MLDKYKIPIALCLVGMVLILGGVFASSLNKPRQFPRESVVEGQKFISVDVSGAVVTPGVYQLNESARIEEAVKAAGGFSDGANLEYISKSLNLAQKLTDGTKVYVPFQGESASVMGTSTSSTRTAISGKVNINTSSQSELEALPGIGPVTASKIISGRPYGSIEELLGKKIVGKSVYEKIKDSIITY